MKRQTQVISHPSQLAGLSVFRGIGPQGTGRLRILDQNIPTDKAKAWESRLNRQYFACGCDKASIGMLAGVIGFPVWLALQPEGITSLGWNGLWIGLATVFVTTMAGKLIGLAGAQRQLTETIAQVQREWKAKPLPEPEDNFCG